MNEAASHELRKGRAVRVHPRQLGLATASLDEVQAVFRLIKRYPRAWTRLDDDIYRGRLNVFKYGVLYRVSDNECVVFVVGYLGRKPIFWRRLLKEARQTS